MTTTRSETGHSPGPWVADDGDGQYFGVFQEGNGGAIAYLVEPGPMGITRRQMLPTEDARDAILTEEYQHSKEHAANARLIAAAPTMLAALKAIINSDMAMREEDEGNHSSALDVVRAAIRKATGGMT